MESERFNKIKEQREIRKLKVDRPRLGGDFVPTKSEQRETGIEPAWLAWKARALPLCYSRSLAITPLFLLRK
jgi:hypothetical protein